LGLGERDVIGEALIEYLFQLVSLRFDRCDALANLIVSRGKRGV